MKAVSLFTVLAIITALLVIPVPGTADPNVQGTATSAQTTTVTSHSVTLPTPRFSGNLLLAIFGYAVTGNTITFPTGWTTLFCTEQTSGTTEGLCVAFRQIPEPEGASITVTSSVATKSASNTYRITGHQNVTIQAPQATNVIGVSANPDPPSLSPSGGAKNYLWIAVASSSDAGTYTVFPGGFFLGIQVNTAGAPVPTESITGSARQNFNIATLDPGTFTHDQGAVEWVAATIAIHPLPVVSRDGTPTFAARQADATFSATGQVGGPGSGSLTKSYVLSSLSIMVNDFLVIGVTIRDCTVTTGMGITFSDSYGNSWTPRLSPLFATASCGTVDYMTQVFTSTITATSGGPDTITVTQTGTPANSWFSLSVFSFHYKSVSSVGNVRFGQDGRDGASPRYAMFVDRNLGNESVMFIWNRNNQAYTLGTAYNIDNGITSFGGGADVLRGFAGNSTKDDSAGGWASGCGAVTLGQHPSLFCGTIDSFSDPGTSAVHNVAIELNPSLAPPIAPSVMTLAATSVASSSAQLNGDLTSLGSETNVTAFFQWGDTLSLGNLTVGQNLIAIGVFFQNLTGLTSFHGFFFRACVFGMVSSSTVCGSTLSFVTPLQPFVALAFNGFVVFAYIGILAVGLLFAYKWKRRREE